MSGDLAVMTELELQNLSISLCSCTFTGLHERLCVWPCLCVCNECVVGGEREFTQTNLALWSTHQVSNCPLLHTTSRKPQNNMNKLVCLTTLPVLPFLQPPSPLLLLPLSGEVSVCLQLHTQAVTKQLYHRFPFTYWNNNVCGISEQQYVTGKLIMMSLDECSLKIFKIIMTEILSHTKNHHFLSQTGFSNFQQNPAFPQGLNLY